MQSRELIRFESPRQRSVSPLLDSGSDNGRKIFNKLLDKMGESNIVELARKGTVEISGAVIKIEDVASPKARDQLYQRLDEALDGTAIDKNESLALRKANKLDLFNPQTAEKLYMDAINGSIDPQTKDQIEEVQKALKSDGKYQSEIDGKWGIKSRQALQDLVLENAQALIQDSSQLKRDDIPAMPRAIGPSLRF